MGVLDVFVICVNLEASRECFEFARSLAAFGATANQDGYFCINGDGRDGSVEFYADRLNRLIERRVGSATGVGILLHWSQRGLMRAILSSSVERFSYLDEPTLDALLRKRFGSVRYIRLRRDSISDGIAHYYHTKYDTRWRKEKESAADARPDQNVFEFDIDKVNHWVSESRNIDKKWRMFFTAAKVNPLIIMPREFTKNFQTTMRGVLEFLDVPVTFDLVAASATHHENFELLAAWKAQYLRSRDGHRGAPDSLSELENGENSTRDTSALYGSMVRKDGVEEILRKSGELEIAHHIFSDLTSEAIDLLRVRRPELTMSEINTMKKALLENYMRYSATFRDEIIAFYNLQFSDDEFDKLREIFDTESWKLFLNIKLKWHGSLKCISREWTQLIQEEIDKMLE